jgi:hypothetical protein
MDECIGLRNNKMIVGEYVGLLSLFFEDKSNCDVRLVKTESGYCVVPDLSRCPVLDASGQGRTSGTLAHAWVDAQKGAL